METRVTPRIFLDYASTTPVIPEVAAVIQEALTQDFGNPSSLHEDGRNAKAHLQRARETIAQAIGAAKEEIFFTSGGTEADSLALQGIARAQKHKKGNHIITTGIEHSAILGTCKILEQEGFDVTYLPVEKNGLVEPDALRNAIQKNTILISIMMANNEIGTIQPIQELAAITGEHQIPFHTDAIQAFPFLPVNVRQLSVDSLSLSAHKIYGPKGVGALYLKKGTPYEPVLKGGAQEREIRPGTENVAGIAGFGKATEILMNEREKDSARILGLRNQLRDGLLEAVSDCLLNGDPEKRLPNNVNISFRHADGESILIHLDLQGISCSMGSACSAGALEPSHVLLGIGRTRMEAKNAIRFSLGKFSTKEEIDNVLKILPPFIKKLRTVSAAGRMA